MSTNSLPKCPICAGARRAIFRSTILAKYRVAYWFCDQCRLLQTEHPYWLEEAYASPIADIDTGLVARNLLLSQRVAALLFLLFDKNGRYLDVAGGYGLFTRLMRDLGFDYYWSDRYSRNFLARGFEVDATQMPFLAVTAFEVIEHLEDPLAFIQAALHDAGTSTMIFSTELFSGEPPHPDAWWYYARSAGQHVSFFTRETLGKLAERLSLKLYTHNGLHMLTNMKMSDMAFRLVTGPVARPALRWVRLRMHSKTFSDHEAIKNLRLPEIAGGHVSPRHT